MDSSSGALSTSLDWAMKLQPGRTLSQIQFALTQTTEALSDQMVAILDTNPLYARHLKENVYARLRESKWKTIEETGNEKPILPSTLKTLHLLGLVGTRDLCLDLRIKRTFGLTGSDLKPDPKATLPLTAQMDSLIEAHRLGYPNHALFAASLFDSAVYGLSKTKLPSVKISTPIINQIWSDSFRSAGLCYLLGAPLVGFELQKFCMSAPVILGIGKLISTQKPGWLEFYDKQKKTKKPYRLVDHFREQRLFPITHIEQAALITELNPLFREISQPLTHHLEAYYLKPYGNPHWVKLAHLIRISVLLTETAGSLDALSDSDWRDLQTSGLPKSTVASIVTKWKRDFQK